MAKHYLHHGGPAYEKFGVAMYGQAQWPNEDDYSRSASHKGNIDFALTRTLAFYANVNRPDHDGGSRPLTSYLANNPIVANDEVVTHLIPNRSLVSEFWWEVDRPVTGVTFDIVLKDIYGTNGGDVVLATGVDGGAAAHGMIDVAAANGGAKYYASGIAEILLVFTALPADGLEGWRFKSAPTLREFERGEH